MNPSSEAHPASRAEAIYASLLKLYPADFRQDYSEEMLHLFSEKWQQVEATSRRHRLQFGRQMFWDWTATMVQEWMAATKSWEFTLGTVSMISLVAFYWLGGNLSAIVMALFVVPYAFTAIATLFYRARAPIFYLLLRAMLLVGAGYFASEWISGLSQASRTFTVWSNPANSWAITVEIGGFIVAVVVMGMSYFRFAKFPSQKTALSKRIPYYTVSMHLDTFSTYPCLWWFFHRLPSFAFGGMSLTFLCIALVDRMFRLWLQPTPHDVPEPRTFSS